MEWLQNFAQEGYALLTALGLNLTTILAFFISWLKIKVQSINKDTLYKELQTAKDEVEIKLRKEYDEKFDQYQISIVNHLESLEKKVMGKIDSNELERKEEIEKQTLQLEATIEASKKNTKATIDEILKT